MYCFKRSGQQIRRGGAIAFALVLLLGVSVLASSCGKKQEKKAPKPYPVAALIVQARGELDLSTGGWDCWLSGDAGVSLFSCDTVSTGPGSSLTLILRDGTMLHFGCGSGFRLVTAEGGGGSVEVTRGEVWLKSGKDGNPPVLTTPAATVTGSRSAENEIWINVEPGGATTVTAAGGSATVTGEGGIVTVDKGETSTRGPGEAAPGKEAAGNVGSGSWGFPSFVAMLTAPYFSDEAARDNAESDAAARIDVGPLDAWAHLNLGRAFLDVGRAGEARNEFEAALSLDPQFTQAFSGVGKMELMEGNWSQAMAAYSRARRADRRSLEAVFGMGQSALGEGDISEAEKWYKEALDVEPEDDGTWVALGIIKFLKHDFETALDDWHKAVSIDPLNTRAYGPMAYLYSLEQKADTAEKYFKKALEVEPDDGKAWNSLGIQHVRLGQLEKATACFRNLQEEEDEAGRKSAGYQNLGVVDRIKGERRKALGNWDKARDLTPGRLPVHINPGEAHLSLGENQQALGSFARAVEIDPEYWYPHQWLARAYVVGGMPAEAQSESMVSISLNPLDWASHITLGLALADQAGEVTGEAAGELEKGRKLAGEELSPSGHTLVGMSYQCEGDYTRALEQYRKAIKLDAADTEARMSVARALILQGDPDGALDELEAAMLIPGLAADMLAELLVLRGNVRDRQEEFDAAIAEYTQAVAYNPARGDAWFYLAGDLERVGRVEEARDAYAKALDLCSGNEQWKDFASHAADKLNR
ncbi:MAG: tetratricopeptide repeat protein [Actinobacteria bacterium]|nr:tetratricopeptide repeat protein [Actinomycetota bacterium]